MAPERITSAETELLGLVSRGLSSKQIAGQKQVSERTIKARLSRIFKKLGVSTRVEAVMVAFRSGYLESESSVYEHGVPAVMQSRSEEIR